MMAEIDWTEFSTTIESLVVRGLHVDARGMLDGLKLKQIPRARALSLAETAWRISYPLLALKILSPIVNPENGFAIAPTSGEKMIYASALVNLGALDEAISTFAEIDADHEPAVLLHKALAYFRTWNYAASVPILNEYIERSDLSDYRRLIGRVNLAAAYIDLERWSEASRLLENIEYECVRNSHGLLMGNCYELQAQVEIFNGRFESADLLLEKSRICLEKQGGEFSLYTRKWQLICNGLKARNSKTNLQPAIHEIESLKGKAAELRHWETIRECDLFQAVLGNDDHLARKLVCGTPHESYRKRVRRLYGKPIVARGDFKLVVSSGSDFKSSTFHPYEKTIRGESLHDKSGLLALFEALSIDFYKPSHVGALFQNLYRGEKFNPFTSPDRVLKVIKRLNHWFLKNEVALRVRLRKSEFSLMALPNHSVEITITRGPRLTKTTGQLQRLKKIFNGRTFTAQQVSEKMDISRSSAQNFLVRSVESGDLVKIGVGRSTSYAVKNRSTARPPKRLSA